MRLLLTGGEGYLAQYIKKVLPENIELWETVSPARFKSLKKQNPQGRYISLDLQKKIASQLTNVYVDLVIHAAAISSLAQAEQNKTAAHRINSIAVSELVEWCNIRNTRIAFLSTDIVFDGTKITYTEDICPQPINIYGQSKYHAEKSIIEKSNNYVILRLALLLGKSLNHKKNFIDWFLTEIKNGKSVPLFFDEIRAPIWVQDAAQIILKVALSQQTGIFHVCGTQAIDRYALGSMLCEIVQEPKEKLQKVSVKQAPILRPPKVVLVNSKLNMNPFNRSIEELLKKALHV